MHVISCSDEHGVIGTGRLANAAIPKEVRAYCHFMDFSVAECQQSSSMVIIEPAVGFLHSAVLMSNENDAPAWRSSIGRCPITIGAWSRCRRILMGPISLVFVPFQLRTVAVGGLLAILDWHGGTVERRERRCHCYSLHAITTATTAALAFTATTTSGVRQIQAIHVLLQVLQEIAQFVSSQL